MPQLLDYADRSWLTIDGELVDEVAVPQLTKLGKVDIRLTFNSSAKISCVAKGYHFVEEEGAPVRGLFSATPSSTKTIFRPEHKGYSIDRNDLETASFAGYLKGESPKPIDVSIHSGDPNAIWLKEGGEAIVPASCIDKEIELLVFYNCRTVRQTERAIDNICLHLVGTLGGVFKYQTIPHCSVLSGNSDRLTLGFEDRNIKEIDLKIYATPPGA